MVGGLVPLIQGGRDRHAVETTWWVEITWLRTRLRWEICR
jgi:hypothetical protein